MAKSKREGFCRLCGNYGELTFEHIPPRKAFNDKGVLLHSLNYISDASYQIAKKIPQRRHNAGLGERSLCGKCNNLTGAWYGDAYVDWAKQGMSYLDIIEKSVSISLPFYIKPLNVLKQIVTMGLAMSSGSLINNYELRKFVLNIREKELPSEYLFYVYLTNKKSTARYMADSIQLDTHTGAMDFVLAEVALPPFGVVILNFIPDRKSSVTDDNLCFINHFSKYDYNVWTTVYLKIPVHRIWSPTPLDYRKID
ncbi:MAG TPA: hypothetical protein VF721_05615 [Pyrinomonadaceae bacterium]|jgi:hypothetical protein